MATVITRSIASSPKRTATETWATIVSLLAPDSNCEASLELKKVSGVAASSIASEALVEDAFVVYGNGPQVRMYCVYGEEAVSGEGINEDSFCEPPAAGDWHLSIPCPPEDLSWMQKKLKSLSSRFSARAVGEKASAEQSTATKQVKEFSINRKEFLKP